MGSENTYSKFIMKVDTNIRLEDVILSDENKTLVRQLIDEISNKERFIEYGLHPINKVLMYGASGTGKTFLSKALSNYLGFKMLYIDIAQALADDNVSKNISEIFKMANNEGNCLIMLDECDSIAWQRDTSNGDTGIIRRATNTLFQQLDQMNEDNIFVSATNMLHRLDAAFERRFDIKMQFTRPKLNLDESIKHFILPKFKVIDDVDSTTRNVVERKMQNYVKLSYYEIKGVIERAMKRAIIHGTNEVMTSWIYDDLAVSMRLKLRFKTNEDEQLEGWDN